MPVGALQGAKRAFVSVLRSLATAYGITVEVTRDSEDAAVTRARRPGAEARAPTGPTARKRSLESALRGLKFDMFSLRARPRPQEHAAAKLGAAADDPPSPIDS